ILTLERFEADDIIGTVAKKAEEHGCVVYMVTPDKDYGQLVSPNIFMYKPGKQGNDAEIWGEKEVCQNWDIKRVDQVVDMLGLVGDAVDNIPGVPGIGPKTAAALLAEFDTVENLLENVDKVKGKNQEKIKQFAEQALLSKRLARIETDVPIDFDEGFTLDPFDREKLSEIFKELEFRTLAQQVLGEKAAPPPKAQPNASRQGSLFGDEPAAEAAATKSPPPLPAHSVAEKTIANVPHEYHLADTPEKRAQLITLLASQSSFCFDTETTNIDPNLAELVGMSFAIKPFEAWYVPVPADQDEARKIVEEFRQLFENEAIEKTGQNIKYDAVVLKWYGVEVRGKWFDTMIAHYLIEPELRHNMDYLAETYLKYEPVSIETLIGKKGSKNQLTMRDVPVEKVAEYAAEDADVTLQLCQFFSPKLQEEGLRDLYDTKEQPLIKVNEEMEIEAVRQEARHGQGR
ncbi:MAG: 5'-3' exonuclease H3TH domain-containing protein, partial [Bacteroidota bacterium]